MIQILGAILPLLGKVIDRAIPDKQAAAAAQLELAKLAMSQEAAALDADIRLALGQLEVNKAEAENPNPFVSGWRPAAGWVCVMGLAYTFLGRPLLAWLSPLADIPIPPDIDTGELMTLLLGMLGLGSLRTYERLKGSARMQ